MDVELPGRGAKRDRLLLTFQASIPTFLVLMTAVSCGTFGIDDRNPSFSLPFLDVPNQQSLQGDEAKPKVRRAQSKTFASSKIAKAKKANTPAQADDKKEQQQLYQEFLEWRKGQKDQP